MSLRAQALRAAIALAVLLGLLFLAVPLIALAARAVVSLNTGNVVLMQPVLQAAWMSVMTSSLSMLGVIALGTPLAYWLSHATFRLKGLVNVLIELPIVMPPVVAGLALLAAFGRRGLLGPGLESLGIVIPFTPLAVMVAQAFVSSPFYIRSAQVRFQTVPKELIAAAQIDGADGIRTFWHITLPLSMRGLLAGLLLSWARALGEFGATILFAGSLPGRTQTMPLLVYNILERDINAALWSGLALVLLAVAILVLVRWLARTIVDDDGYDPLELI